MAESPINQSASVFDTINKYTTPGNIAGALKEKANEAVGFLRRKPGDLFNKPSADPTKAVPAQPVFLKEVSDKRVILRIPDSYINNPFFSSGAFAAGGILFPYTPDIKYSVKASYQDKPVTHANYAPVFYNNSSVGDISITAKFTVQNEADAEAFIDILHMLRALTKMQYGDDEYAGAPPPICRLEAYGNLMLGNTPVVVTDVTVGLPVDVDYFVIRNPQKRKYENSVPVISTITITLKPIYSRREISEFSVKKYLSGTGREEGFL